MTSSAEGVQLFKGQALSQAVHDWAKTFKDKPSSTLWIVEQDSKYIFLDEDVSVVTPLVPKFEIWHGKTDGGGGGGGGHLGYASVKKKTFCRLLSTLLLAKGIKIVLYEYREESQNFQLVEHGTPSDYERLEKYLAWEIRDEANQSQVILGLYAEGSVSQPSVGMFQVCKISQAASYCCFVDNDKLDILESLLTRLNPVECVVPQVEDSELLAKISKFVEEKSIFVCAKELGVFGVQGALKKMEGKLELKFVEKSHLLSEDKNGLLAAALLADVMDEEIKYELHTMNIAKVMRISQNTLEGLHIFGAKSLFQILKCTRTVGGERLLRIWLRQPLRDPQEIQNRLDLVELFVEDSGVRKSLHEEYLRKIPDLEKISQKLSKKRATLSDLYKAYLGLAEIRKLCHLLDSIDGDNAKLRECFLDSVKAKSGLMVKFIKLIEETLEEESIQDNTFKIRAAFDDDLKGIQKQINKVKAKIEGIHNSEARSLSMDTKSLKLESTAAHGYFFRVTLKDERALRKHKNLIVLDSAKSGLKFRTAALERLNSEYQTLHKSYLAHQEIVMKEILEIAWGFAKLLLDLGRKVSELDCLVSLATSAVTAPIPYVKPTIDACGKISLKQARHPCLERKNANYIPNDVEFSSDKNFYIITGPNLGNFIKLPNTFSFLFPF